MTPKSSVADGSRRSRGWVMAGVGCAAALSLYAAYLGRVRPLRHAERLEQVSRTVPSEARGAPTAVIARAPTFTPLRDPAPAKTVKEAAPALGTLPAPPALPEPKANPQPEAEQDPAWKTAQTRAIVRLVEDRAQRVERDIAERERVGDTAGAAELRVLASRLAKQLKAMAGELSELAASTTDKPL